MRGSSRKVAAQLGCISHMMVTRIRAKHAISLILLSRRCARYCTSKIENAIGWRSHVGFEQGVEQIIMRYGRLANSEYRLVVP